jgi:hypothetical protein
MFWVVMIHTVIDAVLDPITAAIGCAVNGLIDGGSIPVVKFTEDIVGNVPPRRRRINSDPQSRNVVSTHLTDDITQSILSPARTASTKSKTLNRER